MFLETWQIVARRQNGFRLFWGFPARKYDPGLPGSHSLHFFASRSGLMAKQSFPAAGTAVDRGKGQRQ